MANHVGQLRKAHFLLKPVNTGVPPCYAPVHPVRQVIFHTNLKQHNIFGIPLSYFVRWGALPVYICFWAIFLFFYHPVITSVCFCFNNKKYHYGIRDIYYLIIAHYCLTFILLKFCDNYVYVPNRVEYMHSECLNNITIIIIFKSLSLTSVCSTLLKMSLFW